MIIFDKTNQLSKKNEVEIAKIWPKLKNIDELSQDVSDCKEAVAGIDEQEKLIAKQQEQIADLENKVSILEQRMNITQEETDIWSTQDTFMSQFRGTANSHCYTSRINFTCKPGLVALNISFEFETTYEDVRTINIIVDGNIVKQYQGTYGAGLFEFEHDEQFVTSSSSHWIQIRVDNTDVVYDATKKCYLNKVNIVAKAKNAKFLTEENELLVITNSTTKSTLSCGMNTNNCLVADAPFDSNFSFDTSLREVGEDKTSCVGESIYTHTHYWKNSGADFTQSTMPYLVYKKTTSQYHCFYRGVFTSMNAFAVSSKSFAAALTKLSFGINNSTGATTLNGFGFLDGESKVYYCMPSASKMPNVINYEFADVFTANRYKCTSKPDVVGIYITTTGNAVATVHSPIGHSSTEYLLQILELGEGSHPTAYYMEDESIVVYLNYRNLRIRKLTLAKNPQTSQWEITSEQFIREGARRIFLSTNGAYFVKNATHWELYENEQSLTPISTLRHRPDPDPDTSL